MASDVRTRPPAFRARVQECADAARQTLTVSLLLFLATSVYAQSQRVLRAPIDLVAPAIPGVVARGTRIELVKDGFQRTEGPVGMRDGSILFTDANRITRIDAQGNASTFVEPSNDSNAVSFDPQGRLIAVQRAPGNEKVGVLYPAGMVTVLADRHEGKPFNRLNDLVVSTRGGVYFTDAAGIYHIPPGGNVTRLLRAFRIPME